MLCHLDGKWCAVAQNLRNGWLESAGEALRKDVKYVIIEGDKAIDSSLNL